MPRNSVSQRPPWPPRPRVKASAATESLYLPSEKETLSLEVDPSCILLLLMIWPNDKLTLKNG